MKKIIFLMAFAGILFSACKKENPKPTPAPTSTPVQKKLMVYVRNFFNPLEDLVYVNITKKNSSGNGWTVMIQTLYTNIPAYGSEETLTLDVSSGEVYTISAFCFDAGHTWGPADYTISADRTAVPIN